MANSDNPKMAQGSPTKDFFVSMLTRDIELTDAILDLIDNCLDGVVRDKSKDITTMKQSDFYSGFFAKIKISDNMFKISDNCGGIPRDTAVRYAFRMGRPADMANTNTPTIGIYGIGMKRAIFKIGQSAIVQTCNADEKYQVVMPVTWASNEANWDFDIVDLDKDMNDCCGTEICVENLNNDILDLWGDDDRRSLFIEGLIKAIQNNYSFIIEKGFEIYVNDTRVNPLDISLLLSNESQTSAIEPFLYYGEIEGVSISLVLGFYAPAVSDDEQEDIIESKRSSGDAGWTVICNDRVVLYNDKSHLTGWGEYGVPQYHTQFIGIRGAVVFTSKDPRKLPMTTTKRGVDTSSRIYSYVKDKMREGLRQYITYTNKWKGRNEQEREFSKNTRSIPLTTFLDKSQSETLGLKLASVQSGSQHKPKLPEPPNDKPYRIIRYSKSRDEIDELVEFFFHDPSIEVKPSEIGEKSFDEILILARSKRGTK